MSGEIGRSFGSVRKARAALLARANELMDGYLDLIKKASEAGEYDVASKAYQYLFDHMPPEDGQRLLEQGIDKPKQVEGYRGPTIQIGFKLGGIDQHTLPESIIEIEPISDDSR